MASLQGDSAAADLDQIKSTCFHRFRGHGQKVLTQMIHDVYDTVLSFLLHFCKLGKNALTSLEATFREAMIEFGLLLQSRGDPGAVEYFRKAAMNKNVCLG